MAERGPVFVTCGTFDTILIFEGFLRNKRGFDQCLQAFLPLQKRRKFSEWAESFFRPEIPKGFYHSGLRFNTGADD